MAQKPSIPKGTRDFGQREMAERNYIFDTIRSVFRTYGYQQIETTPAMENLSTLLGKYGDEGDKLLFRIQNSGEKAELPPEKGLRYDLTVPFARYVVQHQNEISFPFKRYQIQPVWRADRPQKGRYREFYQCDVDVIQGPYRPRGDLRLPGAGGRHHRRHRQAGQDRARERRGRDAGEGPDGRRRRRPADAVAVLRPVLLLSGTTEEKLATMRGLFNGGSASGLVSATGLKGLDELEELFGFIGTAGVSQPVEIDLSLARGLNYYTGAIFEVKALDFPIGSICGGGRYDNLTGIFGLPNVSLPLAKALREAGVSVEVYPEPGKLKKQFDYAAKKAIPFISINGSSEIEAATVNLKNLETGDQQAFPAADLDKILEFLR